MVQSRSETLLRMAQILLVVALAAWNAQVIQGRCDNGWTLSVVKAIGIQCISMILIGSVGSALQYWDYTERQRAKAAGKIFKGTLAGDIADAMNPSSITGMFLHIGLAYALFTQFTANCEV